MPNPSAAQRSHHARSRPISMSTPETSLAGTEDSEQSRRELKMIEMCFEDLNHILRLGRLRLHGPRGAQEFVLPPSLRTTTPCLQWTRFLSCYGCCHGVSRNPEPVCPLISIFGQNCSACECGNTKPSRGSKTSNELQEHVSDHRRLHRLIAPLLPLLSSLVPHCARSLSSHRTEPKAHWSLV